MVQCKALTLLLLLETLLGPAIRSPSSLVHCGSSILNILLFEFNSSSSSNEEDMMSRPVFWVPNLNPELACCAGIVASLAAIATSDFLLCFVGSVMYHAFLLWCEWNDITQVDTYIVHSPHQPRHTSSTDHRAQSIGLSMGIWGRTLWYVLWWVVGNDGWWWAMLITDNDQIIGTWLDYVSHLLRVALVYNTDHVLCDQLRFCRNWVLLLHCGMTYC